MYLNTAIVSTLIHTTIIVTSIHGPQLVVIVTSDAPGEQAPEFSMVVATIFPAIVWRR